MEKRIEDYLHLYLNIPCEFKPSGLEGTHHEYGFVWNLPVSGTEVLIHDRESDVKYASFYHDIKLILRPLSDMTDEEWKLMPEVYPTNPEFADQFSPINFLWLLKQGFDLFGLIEAGLAIDKTTIDTK